MALDEQEADLGTKSSENSIPIRPGTQEKPSGEVQQVEMQGEGVVDPSKPCLVVTVTQNVPQIKVVRQPSESDVEMSATLKVDVIRLGVHDYTYSKARYMDMKGNDINIKMIYVPEEKLELPRKSASARIQKLNLGVHFFRFDGRVFVPNAMCKSRFSEDEEFARSLAN
ncbi:hypothetical protein DAPPUDRAFT_112220 [Daphnia pulex]|uniref:Uncharacterized protein n=1 Tax=Daphnia pulex TaxID=6669 RepID=E9HBB8_DAPPU|nr:hypothetical protein DAPPUDRAFT_112220 [Daphnia pulex]|eukprot:EFX70942.1 hypothetical protein DAPPUDRAFT_112220 [Daphnia pulex]